MTALPNSTKAAILRDLATHPKMRAAMGVVALRHDVTAAIVSEVAKANGYPDKQAMWAAAEQLRTMTSLRGVNATPPTVRHEARSGDEGRPETAESLPAAAADHADTRSASCAPQAPLCGVTRNTGRIEWVCVRPVHDTGTSKNRGRQITGYHPQSERHYFVRKYPRRDP